MTHLEQAQSRVGQNRRFCSRRSGVGLFEAPGPVGKFRISGALDGRKGTLLVPEA